MRTPTQLPYDGAMEDIFAKWLALSNLRSAGLSVPAKSKGRVTMNGARIFIGSGGGGASSKELKPVNMSPNKFAAAFDQAIKNFKLPTDIEHVE